MYGLEAGWPESAARPANERELPASAPRITDQRRRREWQTMRAMIRCFCRNRHGRGAPLCPECLALLDYAALRLERCRFGTEKPTCANCPVHCYQRRQREQIRAVMRYAGPRLLWQHPVLTVLHWLDGLRHVRDAG
jgi:hypothetical protein